MAYDESNLSISAYETDTDVSEDIKGLNWGALFLNWIWGIFNGSYLAFLVFVPVLGFIWIWVCLFKGNEWAWNGKKWKSVEHFHKVQRIWGIVGLISFIIVGYCYYQAGEFTRSKVKDAMKSQPNLNSEISKSGLDPSNLQKNFDLNTKNPDMATNLRLKNTINSAMQDSNSNIPNANMNMPNPNMPNDNPNMMNPNLNAQNPNMQNPNNLVLNEENEKTVLVSVINVGRANPFKPYREKTLASIKSKNFISDLPPPPIFNPDSSVATLLSIKIGGILYDKSRPSAIVNIKGSDYLVHKGDTIFDFFIKNITEDKVTVRTGNNEYRAGIGEIINPVNTNGNYDNGSINANPVRGINRMFGGGPRSSALPDIKIIGLSDKNITNKG